jgi:adenine-specific DNA-methyltransferase
VAKKNTHPAKVDSIRHKDKRANIPTEELRDFVADEEHAPKTMLYPRDPSLDPQLVWKGKDEQDRADLAVPVVPVYIQEKIHPQAIIDDLLAQAAKTARPAGSGFAEEAAAYQIELFAQFNGGPAEFAQKVEFYRHEQNWTNRLILGDSLLVMTSLAEKEGLKGKVQAIYLDPPYGIKFGSNWQVSTRKRDVKDGRAEDATRQPEQVRAFRDTWKLGIHSYLAYLRDRLVVARDLLTETGSVFVQIGDENVHLVRVILDEVFGPGCAVVTLLVKKKSSQRSSFMDPICDYVLWYTKTPRDAETGKIKAKVRKLFIARTDPDEDPDDFTLIEIDGKLISLAKLPGGDSGDSRRSPRKALMEHPGSRLVRSDPLTSGGERANQSLPFTWNGVTKDPKRGNSWKHTAVPVGNDKQSGMERLARADRLIETPSSWRYKRYWQDFEYKELSHLWNDTGGAANPIYVVQTNETIVQRCLLMTTDPGDLVLDPTCGSGTTAYVAEQWGRRWITCDTSRVALALARTRLMAAQYPYYLLADSPEGIKKETELTGKTPSEYKTEGDIKRGFVYKRVPHITSSSIANISDLKEGMTRAQIDAAIAKHADTETLFDQPYQDNRRVRVCGPFSVESLSPHRVLSIADENQDGTVSEQEARKSQDFATMILDNLKKAGVQNTRKGERLTFDRLDPYAGAWLHAAGEYTESPHPNPLPEGEGKVVRRVAVSIGPEHGTVGPQQVKEAAKEAVQGVGFDMLIVCGFAFDPHVAEEVKRYGKLTVLPAKMNPDLAMGDELLKKTGAGNLFMVFGEPDVEIAKQKDGRIVVEIKGVDVYDPTTGQIRNSSTDDIACWFIDTDYNGESFFVRHAYFTGADEPYDKLKRALRAEIDEAAWSSLYSTVSRPFDKPWSGKIAVKVINHYGDEVLKVFEI